MIDNKEYYEQYQWDVIEESGLSGKISKFLETIPEDVTSIIDVGCGNGIITNELGEKYRVLGVDRSANALAHVKTEKLQASSDQIPLPDASFDMALSSEMIEHLDDETLKKTIGEIKRLSKKYIFITVPNNENLNKFQIHCPECGKNYNHSYHLQSFTADKMIKLFPGAEVKKVFYYGASVRRYNNTLAKLKMKICPPASWFPYFAQKVRDEKTMCPFCEHKFVHNYKFNIVAFIIDVFNMVISRKVPYWIFVLFRK
ncbi:MAG TPA: class I SAM-dependent methyltransferase [Bacteroidales bacterium]|nr:class I SAM-dependent methyltransferase [Bacteroidales bacterium]